MSEVFDDLAADLLLAGFPTDSLRRNVDVSRKTSFRLPGIFPLVVDVSAVGQLPALSAILSTAAVDWRILGAGSNLIVREDVASYVVLQLGCGFRGIAAIGQLPKLDSAQLPELAPIESIASIADQQNDELLLIAGAATPLMTLSRLSAQAGFSGLEFAAGIPATVGGALKMNAGAHGRSISDLLCGAWISTDGNVSYHSREQIGCSYRQTDLAHSQLVLAVVFSLQRDDAAAILARRAEALEYRKRTQPLHLPSAGSVFRNPSQTTDFRTQGDRRSAGELLESVGMKGEQVGGVGFSTLHANWLVKLDDSARAADVAALVERAQKRVAQSCGIGLECEVLFW